MANIGIDIRKLDDYGIGTYLYNLVRYIPELDSDNRYFLFYDPKDALTIGKLKGRNIEVIEERSCKRGFSQHLALPAKVKRYNLQVFHSPHYITPMRKTKACKRIVTIHDMSYMVCMDIMPWNIRYQFTYMQMMRSVFLADKIITVSEASAADIAKLLQVPRDRIKVIHNAVDLAFFRDHLKDDNPLAELLGRRPYVLYVGSFLPHKNILNLLLAFDLAASRDKDIALVLVGDQLESDMQLRQLLDALPCRERVFSVGKLPMEQLVPIYRDARLLTLVSLYEGFGLPALEAMACYTPVVASYVPALKEVCKDAAFFVDPYNREEIADGMRTILTDSRLARELVEKGDMLVSGFPTWKDASSRTIDAYRNLLTVKCL